MLEHIRRQRARKRKKQRFNRTLFCRISALVQSHCLDESFVEKLEKSVDYLAEEKPPFGRVRAKEEPEFPLFSPAPEAQYRVTVAIMNTAPCSYLEFANSPDEILLCGPLFRRNPSIEPDRLARHHFESLLLAELAREELRDLGEQVEAAGETRGVKGATPGEGSSEELLDEQSPDSFQQRMKQLRALIAKIEDSESESGWCNDVQ